MVGETHIGARALALYLPIRFPGDHPLYNYKISLQELLRCSEILELFHRILDEVVALLNDNKSLYEPTA